MPHVPRQVRSLLSIALAVAGSLALLALLATDAAFAADTVTIRHLFTASKAQSGLSFQHPQGLAYDATRSEIYVADTGNLQVVVLSRSGVPLHRYQHWVRDASGERIAGEPGAVLPIPGGRLVVTDRLSDRIDILDFRGGVVRSIDVSAQLKAGERAHPGRLDRDAEGRLYVVEQGSGRVLVFDDVGKLVRSFGGRGKNVGEFDKIADVAVGHDGRIYVLDSSGTPGVTAFDREGHWLFGFGRHSNKPQDFHLPVALTVDGAGRIWVADAFSHEVKAYTPEGEFLGTFGYPGDGPGQFYFPSDVAAYADILYVLEKGGRRFQAFQIVGPEPTAGAVRE